MDKNCIIKESIKEMVLTARTEAFGAIHYSHYSQEAYKYGLVPSFRLDFTTHRKYQAESIVLDLKAMEYRLTVREYKMMEKPFSKTDEIDESKFETYEVILDVDFKIKKLTLKESNI